MKVEIQMFSLFVSVISSSLAPSLKSSIGDHEWQVLVSDLFFLLLRFSRSYGN